MLPNPTALLRRGPICVIVVVAAGALVACGSSSSSDVVRAPVSTASSTAATTASTSSSTPHSSAASSASMLGKQTLTVRPATGLHDKQTVQLTGSGFSPGESLTVVECAAKQTATGPGDCNLSGMKPVTTDAKGRASLSLTVLIGPFGANNIVCSKLQPCLISMTQASLTPLEEADAPITFAGR